MRLEILVLVSMEIGTRTMNAQDTTYLMKVRFYGLTWSLMVTPCHLVRWIPNDNPLMLEQSKMRYGVIGVRNNQGFAYDSVRNILYGTSHGPYSDDEVNIIDSAKNYGHPLVIGYAADNNYNGSSAGAYDTSAVPVINNSEVFKRDSIGSSYVDPLFSAYARPQSEIYTIGQHNPEMVVGLQKDGLAWVYISTALFLVGKIRY